MTENICGSLGEGLKRCLGVGEQKPTRTALMLSDFILLHAIIRKLAQAPLDLAFTPSGLDQLSQIILKLLNHTRRIVPLDERLVFPGLDVQGEQGSHLSPWRSICDGLRRPNRPTRALCFVPDEYSSLGFSNFSELIVFRGNG